MEEVNRRSRGIVSDRNRLYWLDFKQLPVLLPPRAEQAQIANFLDGHGRALSRLTRAKQRLIALLNEQKQAIIQQAVTRGLDPDVRLKPSGVEWLGEVPENWEVVQLKRVAVSWCDGPFGSGLKSSHHTDAGRRVVRLQNIRSGYFDDDPKAFISEYHYSTLGEHDVKAGDVLIAGLGDSKIPPGRACVAPAGMVAQPLVCKSGPGLGLGSTQAGVPA